MSIYDYFISQSAGPSQQRNHVQLPPADQLGVTSTEYDNITEVLEMTSARRKRTTYTDAQKTRIARYANMYNPTNALEHFKKEFPYLTEASIRRWVKQYRQAIPLNSLGGNEMIRSKKRGRPLLLPDELDAKLQTFLKNLRQAGGNIDIHVVKGVLMGLIKSDLSRYGSCLGFVVSEGWKKIFV